MEKKKYVVPNMVVVELKHRPVLLDASTPGLAPQQFDWDMDVEAELSE